ncbi:hypothetical protein B0H17DRAFT_1146610 [Mycena rosella]|uniref:Uncharacterized protein n=1 Tax=Mycena rosella TaxID=1033263 RepID=A0AAD7G4P8_MYCRO|nr:hypothetical protein B0H17DRAFT_1146610 [Mycena rosella]
MHVFTQKEAEHKSYIIGDYKSKCSANRAARNQPEVGDERRDFLSDIGPWLPQFSLNDPWRSTGTLLVLKQSPSCVQDIGPVCFKQDIDRITVDLQTELSARYLQGLDDERRRTSDSGEVMRQGSDMPAATICMSAALPLRVAMSTATPLERQVCYCRSSGSPAAICDSLRQQRHFPPAPIFTIKSLPAGSGIRVNYSRPFRGCKTSQRRVQITRPSSLGEIKFDVADSPGYLPSWLFP